MFTVTTYVRNFEVHK